MTNQQKVQTHNSPNMRSGVSLDQRGTGFCRQLLSFAVCALFLGPLLLLMAGTALAVPTMWGTDEDTGHLVKIENYDSTPFVTDYGRLSINDGGTIRPFPDTRDAASNEFSDIESFTLNDHGIAFMVGNSTVAFDGGGTFSGPHLYSLRIFNANGTEAVLADDGAASGGYNAVESIGAISGNDDNPINGIDFDPISGFLFGVVENSNRDDLVVIDPVTAAVTEIKTSMDGTNDIEDIQFDKQGNLYLIDDDGGESTEEDILHLAVLDRSGATPVLQSIQVVNNTGDDHRIESLAWDFQNNKLIGFSDESNSLFQLNTASDGFTDLGGVEFNDIEGIDFVPTPTGLPVPEPASLLLAAVSLGGLFFLRGQRAMRIECAIITAGREDFVLEPSPLWGSRRTGGSTVQNRCSNLSP